MSDDPPVNEAVDWFRRALTVANELEAPPTALPGIADGFAFEDRRSGINFGAIDASGWLEFMVSHWHVGSGRPRWTMREVVAVRGRRTAAFVVVVDYGDDMFVEFIACFRLSPDLQMAERLINFDTDDREQAMAELDRMHAETSGW